MRSTALLWWGEDASRIRLHNGLLFGYSVDKEAQACRLQKRIDELDQMLKENEQARSDMERLELKMSMNECEVEKLKSECPEQFWEAETTSDELASRQAQCLKKKDSKEAQMLEFRQQKRDEDESVTRLRGDAAAAANVAARMQAELDAHQGMTTVPCNNTGLLHSYRKRAARTAPPVSHQLPVVCAHKCLVVHGGQMACRQGEASKSAYADSPAAVLSTDSCTISRGYDR